MQRRSAIFVSVSVWAFACAASPGASAAAPSLLAAERVYADLLDAYGAREAIESGLLNRVDGKSIEVWQESFATHRTALAAHLQQLARAHLVGEDARVLASLQAGFEEFAREPGSSAPAMQCADAARPQNDGRALRAALVSCFREIGDRIVFEEGEMTRVAALQLLQQIEPSARRKQLFLAMQPLWQAVNGDDSGGDDSGSSPYRRLIGIAANDAREHGSHIEAAARSLGWSTQELESALVQVLETWRRTAVGGTLEPWDYRFHYAEASRALDSLPSREALQPVVQRYFEDLGADPRRLRVAYDLEPRAGKAPVAYTDFIRIGRLVEGAWRPAKVRVSASVERGGLFTAGELVHETGHAVHLMAIRARPAYFWPDAFFGEVFGEVVASSVYEPAWQRKYLGRSVCRSAGVRERYSLVMLDMAWSLFEIRMLRDPQADPNRVWTEITSHYLGIAPHPEWSWWATRVQLVSSPGYMANYGVGALLTAELRARIRSSIGPFDAGNPQWYPWLSEHLLRFGSQRPTPQLLVQFLGRRPSSAALLDDIQRVAEPAAGAAHGSC